MMWLRSIRRAPSPPASRRSKTQSWKRCLAIIVVFLFLQSWRATLIPLLAVPVSLIGTFVVFPLLGFSINTLSLFGLVPAIGLVVDDAIVVVEAVEHHIEQGMSSHDATIQAMEEVWTGGGHCPDFGRGIHSNGIHSRDYRQAVSAICGHHRSVGDLLRLQRVDAEPGSAGNAFTPEKRVTRAAGALSSGGLTGYSAKLPTTMSAPPGNSFAKAGLAIVLLPVLAAETIYG